jgi:hypothetical protein
MTSLVWRVKNLVVEDGKVESQAKTDWVSWSKVGHSNLSSILVCLQRLVGRQLALVTERELGQVTVIVTLPKRR